MRNTCCYKYVVVYGYCKKKYQISPADMLLRKPNFQIELYCSHPDRKTPVFQQQECWLWGQDICFAFCSKGMKFDAHHGKELRPLGSMISGHQVQLYSLINLANISRLNYVLLLSWSCKGAHSC